MEKRFIVNIIIGLMIFISGCTTLNRYDSFSGPGRIEDWPRRDWEQKYVYKSPSYIVYTNTSPEAAEYLVELMEQALKSYQEVTGFKAKLPTFTVNAYSTKKEYEQIAKSEGFTANLTSGMYSPVPPAAIHLPYAWGYYKHPSVTLLHEGMHQFLDQTMRFEVPTAYWGIMPHHKRKLVSIRLWLNEGLSTYTEGFLVGEDKVELDRINQERLDHLKDLIKEGKCPSLEDVLSRRYGQSFSSADYALSWGIVYYLRTIEPDGKAKLKRYLQAVKRGFFDNPKKQFPAKFIVDGRSVKDFTQKWFSYIAQESLLFFKKIVVGDKKTLKDWERDWRRQMNNLNFRIF